MACILTKGCCPSALCAWPQLLQLGSVAWLTRAVMCSPAAQSPDLQLVLIHQERPVLIKSATMACSVPSCGWPVELQVLCCNSATATINRSRSAGWSCRAVPSCQAVAAGL